MQIELITKSDYDLLLSKIDMLLAAITTKPESKTAVLLEVTEAAKKLRVSEKTLRSYIELGKLPAINLNKNTPLRPIFKIEESEVEKFIRSKRTS